MLQVLGFVGVGLGFTVVGKNILESNNNKTSFEQPNNDTTIKPIQTPLESKYDKLNNYLAAEKWEEADKETLKVMLAVTKREKEGWLDFKDIDNFPCEDLRTIGHLPRTRICVDIGRLYVISITF